LSDLKLGEGYNLNVVQNRPYATGLSLVCTGWSFLLSHPAYIIDRSRHVQAMVHRLEDGMIQVPRRMIGWLVLVGWLGWAGGWQEWLYSPQNLATWFISPLRPYDARTKGLAEDPADSNHTLTYRFFSSRPRNLRHRSSGR
jgi:hypothetical protein